MTQLQEFVRLHPGRALLAAAGLGFATVLVVRALAPTPPPRNRAARFLEDIQHRLAELTQPAYDKVASLAENGAHSVGRGVEKLEALHLNRKCDSMVEGLKNLFR
jgi:hypothetical protein